MLKLYWNLWKFKLFFHQEKFYQYLLFLFKEYKDEEDKMIQIFSFYQQKIPYYFDYNSYILFLEFSIFYKKLELAKIILNHQAFFYQGKGIDSQGKSQSLFLNDLYLNHHPLWIILNCSHSFWQLLNHKDNHSNKYSHDYLLEFSQYVIEKLSLFSFISKEQIYKIYEYCHPHQKILLDAILLNLQLIPKKNDSKLKIQKI
jgi:hypothetical protein